MHDGDQRSDVRDRKLMNSTDNNRYARQQILPEIGANGQAKLAESTVLIVGCGALGCFQADLLARAGLGRLRIGRP